MSRGGAKRPIGGARPGAGPPPMPSGDRRSVTVRVRLTEAQASALVEVELERGLTTRDVLLAGVAALTSPASPRGGHSGKIPEVGADAASGLVLGPGPCMPPGSHASTVGSRGDRSRALRRTSSTDAVSQPRAARGAP